ncbi:MAG TPA: FAD-binding oxidoreductase [Candidatus Dormibacteraeota bacterium]
MAETVLDKSSASALARELSASFAGDVLVAGQPGYDEARAIWNAMVDKNPLVIARCASTEDVVVSVNLARRHGLQVSVRCGGHGVTGKALSEGGITIDLTGMRRVEIDTEKRIATIQGGCLLGDVDAATAQHGLVVPAGIVSETGVGGLALGGGIGWFSRKHALTCDNFLSLKLVTASGEVVTASETEHPDLFWALHGGGGNFGAVTEFELKAHRFGPEMRIGVALHHPEDAVRALAEYAQIYPELPDHVGWHAALKQSMPPLPFVPEPLRGKRLLLMIVMYLADSKDEAGEKLVDRLIAVGNPAATAQTVMPFGARVQKLLDPEFPNGNRYYTKEAHIDELPEEALDVLVSRWLEMKMSGEIEIIGLGGAMARVHPDATAFANRHNNWWLNFALHWDDAELDSSNIAQIRAAHEALKPWLGTGVYANMLNFDEADRLIDAYGGQERYDRLARVKAQYDPDNFFRSNNASIAPAAKPSRPTI